MATSPEPPTSAGSRTAALIFLATVALGVLHLSSRPVSALGSGTECGPLHGRAPLTRNDGAMVYEGDPAKGFLLRPNRQESGPGGAWRNHFSFRPGVQITVVCSYVDGHRYAFALSPSTRACTKDARSFACR